MRRQTILALLVLVLLAPAMAEAQKVRIFKKIAAPEQPPEGTELIEEMAPPDPATAQAAITEALQGWNEPGFGGSISEDFQDKDRLLDNFSNDVPLDAELRVTGVRNYQPMQQFGRIGDNGNVELTTRVQFTADTEIQFNDPARGFRRLTGTNDFVADIVEELVPIVE